MGVEDTKVTSMRFIRMEEKIKKVIKKRTKEERIGKVRAVPEPPKKATEQTSESAVKIAPNGMNLDGALKELRKSKKRKFVQTVDLIVNLQKFDSRKDSINSFIQLPNIYERKIGAFLTTNVKGIDVVLKDSFDSYKNIRDSKRLAKSYDMFIASAPLMGQLATKFGRALGPSGKMPSPQLGIILKEDEETIKKLIDKMKRAVKIKTKERVIKIGVGKEDMSDEALKQNIEAAVKGITELLPQKNDNLKEILIKFTMTPPVKINL
jgi:large subunit ribosomal protein L1